VSAVETYYSLLSVTPRASAREAEIAFRRFVARYRPTLTVEQLFADPRFLQYVNAYLTLTGGERQRHDELTARPPAPGATVILPTPLAQLDAPDRCLLLARIALWRREHIEGIHLLRTQLERTPAWAAGWAMLGEIFLQIDRLAEGIKAYERAVQLEQEAHAYAARLQQARDALDGIVELQIEPSPEEELLREERARRWRITLGILILGVAMFAAPYFRHPIEVSWLYAPWPTICWQSGALLFIFAALAFGRLLEPFERVMLWNALRAGDRGRLRSYPYALILFVASCVSLWLGAFGLLVMALTEEEWPVAPGIMMGVCAAATLLLTGAVYVDTHHQYWIGTLLVGGNLFVLASMLGWWIGSLDSNMM